MEKIYVVIHYVTFVDGGIPNHDDNMIGCFSTLEKAKIAVAKYTQEGKGVNVYNHPLCCSNCKEVCAYDMDNESCGERWSIYEMQIH